MKEKSKTVVIAEEVKEVSFKTTVDIDLRGVIEVQTRIRNANSFGKHKVSLNVRMMNNGSVLHQIEMEPVNLYGTIIAAFVPGKKSSYATKLVSSMSFDDVVLRDPETVGKSLKNLDADIGKVASELRQMRVLSDTDSEELQELAQKLQELKVSRTIKLHELNFLGKFDAITIDVQHFVE